MDTICLPDKEDRNDRSREREKERRENSVEGEREAERGREKGKALCDRHIKTVCNTLFHKKWQAFFRMGFLSHTSEP